MQTPALALQEIVGMAVWHYSILGLIVSAMIWLIVSIAESHGILDRLMDNKAPLSVLLVITCLASTLLMVNSVEHIHLVQYIILVFLLVPLLENSFAAMIVAILVGAVDEGYQFFFLHDWQGYLDFNDIVLNSIGAAWGVALFEIIYIRKEYDIAPLEIQKRLIPVVIWCSIYVILVVLFFTGVLGMFTGDGMIVLSRFLEPDPNGPATRWIDTLWGNHWYHLTTMEGLVLVFLSPITAVRTSRVLE